MMTQMKYSMRRKLSIFICLLWGGLAFAQDKDDKSSQNQEGETKPIEKIRLEGYRMKEDTIHLPLKYSLYAFSLKMVSPTVMNIPTRNYKDRFLVCENCQILDFKQTKLHYIDELYISVPRTQDRALLTLNSKEGKRLTEFDVLIHPNVNFFLKINEEALLSLDTTSTINVSSIQSTDELRFVATTEDGKKIDMIKHSLIPPNLARWEIRHETSGNLVDYNEMQRLLRRVLSSGQTSFLLKSYFLDKEGNEWSRSLKLNIK